MTELLAIIVPSLIATFWLVRLIILFRSHRRSPNAGSGWEFLCRMQTSKLKVHVAIDVQGQAEKPDDIIEVVGEEENVVHP